MRYFSLLALLSCFAVGLPLAAQEWSRFRGPCGQADSR